eukprot:9478794-Pyramimonas_sp.AAC.1
MQARRHGHRGRGRRGGCDETDQDDTGEGNAMGARRKKGHRDRWGEDDGGWGESDSVIAIVTPPRR